MIQRIAWVVAGLFWAALSFLVGLYVSFPEDAAKARLVYEVDKASNHEYAMEAGGLSLWRLSGVNLTDVQLYTVKKGRKTKDDPKPAMERTPLVSLERLGLRVAPLQALAGKQAVAFLAEVSGGALDGVWAQGEGGVELAFEASDIDLAKMDLSTAERTLNLVGKIDGEADLVLNTADVKSSSGHLKLSFPGLGLAEGSAIGGFQLPAVTFEKAVLAFEVKDGKMAVTEGTFESNALTAGVSGDITLNKKLARSRYRLDLTFTLPEDLDQLAQIAPDMKRARDSDGNYHFLVSGTVFSPNFRPSRAGSRAKSTAKGAADDEAGPTPADGPFAGSRDFDPDMSEDDRKAAREERIRERRERLRERREKRQREREAQGGEPVDGEMVTGGGKRGRGAEDEGPPFPDDEEPLPPGLDDGPQDFGGPPGDFEGPPPDFEGPPE